MKYDPNEIKVLKPVNQRDMTVGELIKALQEYPNDRKVHVAILTDYSAHWRRMQFEVKDVSMVVEMDKNITHPVLQIDKIEFEQA